MTNQEADMYNFCERIFTNNYLSNTILLSLLNLALPYLRNLRGYSSQQMDLLTFLYELSKNDLVSKYVSSLQNFHLVILKQITRVCMNSILEKFAHLKKTVIMLMKFNIIMIQSLPITSFNLFSNCKNSFSTKF